MADFHVTDSGWLYEIPYAGRVAFLGGLDGCARVLTPVCLGRPTAAETDSEMRLGKINEKSFNCEVYNSLFIGYSVSSSGLAV